MRPKKSTKEVDALRKEAQSIIIKRSGISLKRLYEHAIDEFVANNIDLLTSEERERFRTILGIENEKKFSKTWEAAIKSKGTVTINDPALFL